jgi:hypothetical protein
MRTISLITAGLVLVAFQYGCDRVDAPTQLDDDSPILDYRESEVGVRAGFGTAVVDGVLEPEEWSSAGRIDLQVNVFGGATAPARIYIMNDGVNLYYALELDYVDFNRSTFTVTTASPYGKLPDLSSLDFFADAILANSNYGSPDFYDDFRYSDGSANYGREDQREGGTEDGSSGFSQNGGVSVWEMAHPLNSGDSRDLCVTSRAIAVNFFVRLLNPGPVTDTDYPSNWGTDGWIPLKTTRSKVNPGDC